MIALLDYHAGNLTSVRKALAAVGADVFVPTQPQELRSVNGIIVPGVGHFSSTRAIDPPWVDAIRARVADGIPLLGICLGMQWLYESSEEDPDLPGLGVFGGTCVRLVAGSLPPVVKVPHVGWNTLQLSRDAWITRGVPDDVQVYFTHSYVAPITADSVAVTIHGDKFTTVVERGAVAGVQFHPEKSGPAGLQILRNFVARTSAVH